MKSYTVYRSDRTGVLECASFQDGKMILHTWMEKEASAIVQINTANIRLISEYDTEQTLIPGVTRRAVLYRGTSLRFCDIRWNRDETYTVDFGDETMNVSRDDPNSYVFSKDGETVARIGRYPGGTSVIADGHVRYEPAYTVQYEENLSQQALIMAMIFPLLYFGF